MDTNMNTNMNDFRLKQQRTGNFYLNKLNINFNRKFKNRTSIIIYLFGFSFYMVCLYFFKEELKIIFQFKLLKEIFSKIPFYILLLGYFGMTGFTLVYFGILKYFTNAIIYLSMGFLILSSIGSLIAFLSGKISFFYGIIGFLLSLATTIYTIYLFTKYKRIINSIAKASTKEAFNNIFKYTLALILPFIIILFQFWISFSLSIFYIPLSFSGKELNVSKTIICIYIDFFSIWTFIFIKYLFQAYVTSTVLIDLHNNSTDNNSMNHNPRNVNSMNNSTITSSSMINNSRNVNYYACHFTLMSSGSICLISLIFAILQSAKTLIRFSERKLSQNNNNVNRDSRRNDINGGNINSNSSGGSIVSKFLLFIILFIFKIFINFIDQSLKFFSQYSIPDMMATGNNLVESIKNSYQICISDFEQGFAIGSFVKIVQYSFFTFLSVFAILIGGIFNSFTREFFFNNFNSINSINNSSNFNSLSSSGVFSEIFGNLLILPGFIFAYLLGTVFAHCVSTLIYSSYALGGDLSISHPDLMEMIYNFNRDKSQHNTFNQMFN